MINKFNETVQEAERHTADEINATQKESQSRIAIEKEAAARALYHLAANDENNVKITEHFLYI